MGTNLFCVITTLGYIGEYFTLKDVLEHHVLLVYSVQTYKYALKIPYIWMNYFWDARQKDT